MSTTSDGPKFPQKTLDRMTTQNPKRPPRQGTTLAAEKSRGSAPPLLVLRKVTEIQSCFSAVAETRHVRAAGFFAAFGERNSDVGSMSAPVFNYAGHLAAVLGVGFP